MDPGTRNALLVTIVALLAIGLSAATLTSTVDTGGDNDGGGGGAQPPSGIPDLDLDNPDGEPLPPIVGQIIAALLVLGVLLILAYGLIYRKQAAVLVGLLLGAVVALWLLVQLLSLLSVPEGALGGLFGGLSGLVGGSGSGSGEVTSTRNLVVVAAVVGLGLLAIFLFSGVDRTSADSADESTDDTESAEDDGVREMGKIAGRTADRIENQAADEALDNQVYEAYSEMTAQFDVPSEESTTPREFADAAAERGMATEDVAALTDLFEAVRYGGYDATPDREQEAVETLRRIERRYTDE
jgi:hypothetical protein